ncbi:MAG: hypothetical protein LIO41_03420 [Ruminococcus sp.]|nr:hypothetical protein [Ruminococcus sp.]MCD7773565.1 hypothetical protein [Ruminococcus sp.]
MTGMTVSDFIEAMYNCAEIEFAYHSKRYMLEMWKSGDDLYCLSIDTIEPDSKKVFSLENRSIADCVAYFEIAKIFDGRTIYEAEKEIEVLFG